MIAHLCPSCGRKHELASYLAGETYKCDCGASFVVPSSRGVSERPAGSEQGPAAAPATAGSTPGARPGVPDPGSVGVRLQRVCSRARAVWMILRVASWPFLLVGGAGLAIELRATFASPYPLWRLATLVLASLVFGAGLLLRFGSDGYMKWRIKEAIKRDAPAVAQEISIALESGPPDGQCAAIQVLEEYCGPDVLRAAAPALARALRSPDEVVRARAALLLGTAQGPSSPPGDPASPPAGGGSAAVAEPVLAGPELEQQVQSLVKLLWQQDAEVRGRAAKSLAGLARSGTVDVVGPLLDVLQTSITGHARAAAVRTLGVIGDRRALEPLCRATADPDHEVVVAAIIALGLLRAIGPLLALLERITDKDTKEWVANALTQATGRKVPTFSWDKDPASWRRWCAENGVRIQDEA